MTPVTAKTVLLVDDDPDFLEQMAFQFEQAGLATVSADGEAAGRLVVEGGGFDLAVVDLMMEHPDSGFVLCHLIRRRWPGVPVILVTAVAGVTGLAFDASTREERAWVAADTVLDKPVRFEQLRREVRRLLRTGE